MPVIPSATVLCTLTSAVHDMLNCSLPTYVAAVPTPTATITMALRIHTVGFPNYDTPEFYATLAAVILALAWPLLPQPGLEDTLALASLNCLPHVVSWIAVVAKWCEGRENIPVGFPAWVPLLVVFSWLISLGRWILSDASISQTEIIVDDGVIAFGSGILIWTIISVASVLIVNRPEVQWARSSLSASNRVLLDIASLVLYTWFSFSDFAVQRAVSRCLLRISARQVFWWTWLGIERTGTLAEIFALRTADLPNNTAGPEADVELLSREDQDAAKEENTSRFVFAPRWSVLLGWVVHPVTVALNVVFYVKWIWD